jgi:hypothetical protein
MESYYHTPKAKWVREMKLKYSGGSYTCEYYEEAAIDDDEYKVKKYTNVKVLMVYIEKSNTARAGAVHDDMKRKDG